MLVPRLVNKEEAMPTISTLEKFADKGLRTLFFASRDLDNAEFQQWFEAYEKANAEIEGREAKVGRSLRDAIRSVCTKSRFFL